MQKNATHGRYAEGWVQLHPRFLQRGGILQLSAEPSSESKQPMQPNLLHVTIMNGSERKAAWKSTLTPMHWRVKVSLLGDMHLLY